MKLIVASGNKGKLEEIIRMFQGLPWEPVSMAEAGYAGDIEETGTTFEANALIKARHLCQLTGLPSLGDDSGLEVDALNGAPGVYSARYAGPGATDTDRNVKLLKALADVDDSERTARFVCVMALVFPDGREVIARGQCEGVIAREPAGSNGFGYDPLFYVPDYQKTVSEMDAAEKDLMSHRGRALRLLVRKLTDENGVH